MTIEEKKIPVTEEKTKAKIEFVTTEEEEKDLITTETEEDILEDLEEDAEEVPAAATEENAIDRFNAYMRSFFKPGTFTCGAFGVCCGGLLAVLCLTLGFWPTLLLGGAAGIGGFLGGASREKGHAMDSIKKRLKDSD